MTTQHRALHARRRHDPLQTREAWLYGVTGGHLIIAAIVGAALAEAPWPTFMWIAVPTATLSLNVLVLVRWERAQARREQAQTLARMNGLARITQGRRPGTWVEPDTLCEYYLPVEASKHHRTTAVFDQFNLDTPEQD